MIYGDAQFASSLTRVVIGFTLSGIEAITIYLQSSFDPKQKNGWFQKYPSYPTPMEGEQKFSGGGELKGGNF